MNGCSVKQRVEEFWCWRIIGVVYNSECGGWCGCQILGGVELLYTDIRDGVAAVVSDLINRASPQCEPNCARVIRNRTVL